MLKVCISLCSNATTRPSRRAKIIFTRMEQREQQHINDIVNVVIHFVSLSKTGIPKCIPVNGFE